jgi:hypothetical protein
MQEMHHSPPFTQHHRLSPPRLDTSSSAATTPQLKQTAHRTSRCQLMLLPPGAVLHPCSTKRRGSSCQEVTPPRLQYPWPWATSTIAKSQGLAVPAGRAAAPVQKHSIQHNQTMKTLRCVAAVSYYPTLIHRNSIHLV